MSKVYDALRRAGREGRWQGNIDTLDPVYPTAPPLPDSAAQSAASSLDTSEHEAPPPAFEQVAAWEQPEAFEAPPMPQPEPPAEISAPRPSRPAAPARRSAAAASEQPLRESPQREQIHHEPPQRDGRFSNFWSHAEDRTVPPLIVGGSGAAGEVAEQFQNLRSRIEGFFAEQPSRVILVASALAGEGKSFVSLNLAATLAMSKSRVVLIDADFRRPSLDRVFNLLTVNGLKSYLENSCSFEETLHSTSFQHLSLVPAGGQVALASELIAGPQMREYLDRLRRVPNLYVIIDAPAALVFPDAQILSRIADAVLFVAAANSTPRTTVQEALALFSEASVMGVVFNRFQHTYSESKQLGYGTYAYPERQHRNGSPARRMGA